MSKKTSVIVTLVYVDVDESQLSNIETSVAKVGQVVMSLSGAECGGCVSDECSATEARALLASAKLRSERATQAQERAPDSRAN